MISTKIRAAALLTMMVAPLTACSDATLLDPTVADAQFARADNGKPPAVEGIVWGGLMSSKRLLEEYLRGESHTFPVGNRDATEGILWAGSSPDEQGWYTDVQVNIRGAELIDGTTWEIPFRLEGYGTIMFYCEHNFNDDWPDPTFYHPMPFVATGVLQVSLEGTFRSAADVRAWLGTGHAFNLDILLNDPVVVTYDENCVPTQVFP